MKGNSNARLTYESKYESKANMKVQEWNMMMEAMDAREKKTRRKKFSMKLQCPNPNAQTPSPKFPLQTGNITIA